MIHSVRCFKLLGKEYYFLKIYVMGKKIDFSIRKAFLKKIPEECLNDGQTTNMCLATNNFIRHGKK